LRQAYDYWQNQPGSFSVYRNENIAIKLFSVNQLRTQEIENKFSLSQRAGKGNGSAVYRSRYKQRSITNTLRTQTIVCMLMRAVCFLTAIALSLTAGKSMTIHKQYRS
jgi:hypothetical protein